jgi:hypothetical protein
MFTFATPNKKFAETTEKKSEKRFAYLKIKHISLRSLNQNNGSGKVSEKRSKETCKVKNNVYLCNPKQKTKVLIKKDSTRLTMHFGY